jgi:hypothetical protein
MKPSSDAIAADEAKLAADKAALTTLRATYDRDYNLFIDVAEHDAKNEQDLQAMNLKPLPTKATMTTLSTPELINIVPPKKGHGYSTASVHETGKTRHRYVAQSSIDPYGPATWQLLPGTGKTRRLTGAPGTKVWVRFALVHRQQQSDWSAPVLVVIP